MLIRGVAELVARVAVQLGHVHAVVVDQHELVLGHHHVAVLEVAVRDAFFLQQLHQLRPILGEPAQRLRIGQQRLDVFVDRQATDPLHLEDRDPAAAYADAILQILEADLRQPRGAQMLVDRLIPLLHVGQVAQEAAHRPLVLAAAELVDRRVAARDRARQTELRQYGRTRLQVGIAKTQLGRLDRFLVIGDSWPMTHDSCSPTGGVSVWSAGATAPVSSAAGSSHAITGIVAAAPTSSWSTWITSSVTSSLCSSFSSRSPRKNDAKDSCGSAVPSTCSSTSHGC